MLIAICILTSFGFGAVLTGWFLCHFSAKIIDQTIDKVSLVWERDKVRK